LECFRERIIGFPSRKISSRALFDWLYTLLVLPERFAWRGRASDRRDVRDSKAAWEQHRLGEAASLPRDRNFKVKSPRNSSRAACLDWFFHLCVHVQLAWELGNFSSSSVPLIESLKSKTHLVTDAEKRKNLTHRQLSLLFKDSSQSATALWAKTTVVIKCLVHAVLFVE